MTSITESMTREEIAALLSNGRMYSAGRDTLYTVEELMARLSVGCADAEPRRPPFCSR
jgi:hypothetical protein